MVVVALIFGVVGTIVGILSFLNTLVITNKLLEQDQTHTTSHEQESKEENDGKFSKEFKEGFMAGQEHTWFTIQLSLFDMFKEAEIFDFEGQVENIQRKMNKILDNDSYRKKLTDELQEYVKGLSNDSDDY